MIERFSGEDGARRVVAAMVSQSAVHGDEALARRLAERGTVVGYAAGDDLMVQDASDNDVLFILSGRAAVLVHGRELAVRHAGQHVGEMAVIDVAERRSATVRALDEVVVLRISESRFSSVATEYPDLWRRLAIELGRRLRERTKHVRPPNPRPIVFIGSSAEGLSVAEELQRGLAYTDATVQIWTNNVFTASRGTMESLEAAITCADFGVFVFTADDQVSNEARKSAGLAPRDNVILELGMCLGAIGRNRTFFVVPRGASLKIPTDLLGITPLDYRGDDAAHLAANLGPACTGIKEAILRMRSR